MGLVVVRYGEIGLKGENQDEFLRQLRRNMRDCLRKHGIAGEIRSTHGRIYVETDHEREAAQCLQKVFGIASLSPALEVPSELEAMRQAALEVARRAGLDHNRSFRVRASRADKRFPLTSPEIGRELGDIIHETLGARVDLSDRADLTVGVEVRPEGTLIFGETLKGPGGLPIDGRTRVVALVSGGIDSPVAAWMMMKRGCGVIPLHFKREEAEAAKALANCEVLASWSYGWEIKPIVLDHEEVFGEIFRKLQQLGEQRWTCVFCKRALLLKACEVADQYRALAVVTGENMGQVASQTLHNMVAISYGIPKPILRPLVGFDKAEIMDLAKRIGTFDISIRESVACPYLPRHPITMARLDEFLRILEQVEKPAAEGEGHDESIGL